jgi:protein-disulfide isomerase
MIGAAISVIWQNVLRSSGQPPARTARLSIPKEPVAVSGAASRGALNATVAIIEFSDFQCPYCGKVERETLPALENEYVASGKVRLVFKNMPLLNHPFAQRAAEAAACAGLQGRFWSMHDRLFDNQVDLDDSHLQQSARAVGLDLKRFSACLGDGTEAAFIRADQAQTKDLGLSGTPTFLFGTVLADGRVRVTDGFAGARPLSDFESVLNRLLRRNPVG